MELDDHDFVSPFTLREPGLRKDLICASLCHGKANELYCTPFFKCFDTIGDQCLPGDLYRLIL